jgi:hypothetical protein
MKLIKILKINKFLNIKLIKNKIYGKKQDKFNQMKLELKKNIKIIFKFFLINKKILFLGIYNKLNNFILNLIKNTKHSYLTNGIWFKGITTNSYVIFKYLVLLKNLSIYMKFLFNLNKINLIVIFEPNNNVFELLNFRVPILSFANLNNYFYNYKLNFFFKDSNISFFYFFLSVIKLRVQILQNKNGKFK